MKFQPQALTPYVSARHYFGSEQRRHRERARLSLVQLAGIVNSSKSALARVETAELMPPPDLPARLDAAFGTDEYFHGLYQLAKREAHPDQYRRYMDFEARAEVMEDVATHVVPGMLQSEAYARAFFGYVPGITPEEIEERVQARLGRQERLRSASAARYWAILDEAVLHRPVGGPAVMHGQLESLLTRIDTPHTKVQVLPFRHGGYALMEGPVTLLRLPGRQVVAYEEGRKSGHLLEDPEEVNQRWALYDALRAYALSPEDSASLIRQVMEGYEPCESESS
ncbi:helix-turn-helix domain-containing protein [Streptomyces sp. PR69]|uniref:helix-turn-helix domain-containing protein n=1 Tax=Streptomyces sp. PR69 TaxID=2984950 RepID=UPI002264358E|nr:helix-turn-helix transcriptional regulator [Streptomyces sp. PR69]